MKGFEFIMKKGYDRDLMLLNMGNLIFLSKFIVILVEGNNSYWIIGKGIIIMWVLKDRS